MFAALCCTGCDIYWLEDLLRGLIGQGPGDTVTLTPKPDAVQVGTRYVTDQKLQDVLDMTVRYSLVQDRARPQYTLAETLALGGKSACGVEEPGTLRMNLTNLGSPLRVAVDYENPLLNTGLFLSVLALRDLNKPHAVERQLIKRTLHRLRSLGRRTSEPGYFLRFDYQHDWSEDQVGVPDAEHACGYPNGYCTVINQGPYRDGDEKYQVNNIPRHWEPSADEIIGLMLGLSFSYHYVRDDEIRGLAKSVAADLASYLRRHSYFLERPCADGGIAWRGGHLASYTYPFERIFASMGLGYDEPSMPSVAEFCRRNQLVARPFSALLPCTPIMRDHDDSELAAMIDAMQIAPFADPQRRFELWTDGAQFPGLKITSSGLNLAAFVFLALQPIDDDGSFGNQYEQWYRNLQMNNPKMVTPLWAATLALYGKKIHKRDLPLLDTLSDDNQVPPDSLPEFKPGWHSDVTSEFLLPVFVLGAAQGHVVNREIRAEALPIDF